MQFWISLWTLVWFGSLAVFSVLSLLVIVFGFRDLVDLFRTLRERHRKAVDQSY